MATVMTETTTAKVREEQVTGLTAENAHRVTMIREKGTDHPPVPFHFRKEHHGTGNYVHLYGNPEDRNELHSRDFKDWEAVAFKHPAIWRICGNRLATHTPGVPSTRRFVARRTS